MLEAGVQDGGVQEDQGLVTARFGGNFVRSGMHEEAGKVVVDLNEIVQPDAEERAAGELSSKVQQIVGSKGLSFELFRARRGRR